MTPKQRTSKDQKSLKLLGASIRKWRERKGFTQEQLAPLVNFTRSYITEIETGKRNVSYLNLMKIINILEVDESDWKELTSQVFKDEV